MGFLFEVLLTIFTVTSLWSTVVWFCRCSMTLLKNVPMSYEMKELLGSYTLEQNTKILTFIRIPIWRQFKPLSLAINLVTWLADFFCELAKELNKKARANTKSKRNIFTFRALRYEMADESVSIRGTTFHICLFCPTTGKFRMSKGLCYEKCLQCTMRICSLWIMIC